MSEAPNDSALAVMTGFNGEEPANEADAAQNGQPAGQQSHATGVSDPDANELGENVRLPNTSTGLLNVETQEADAKPQGTCSSNMMHLAPQIPAIQIDELITMRDRILATNFCADIDKALAGGMTLQQFAEGVFQEAAQVRQYHDEMQENYAEHVRQIGTMSLPKGISMRDNCAHYGTDCIMESSMLGMSMTAAVLTTWSVILYEEITRQIQTYL